MNLLANPTVSTLPQYSQVSMGKYSSESVLLLEWTEFNNFLPHSVVNVTYAAAAKSLQLCPTLCNPIDSSPPGSAVPEILQARTLEWVAISFSNA